MLAQDIPFYQNKAYLANALSHFSIDVLNNSRNVIFGILAVSMGLADSDLGLIALIYAVGNALLQPAFGWAGDKFGARWLVIGGTGWMILFYGIGALAPENIAIIALTIAGIGSGAFHPSGTMVAGRSSKSRRNQATAYFFMAGQIGLFLGPVIAGVLLDQWGRPGYALLPLIATIPFIMDLIWLREDGLHPAHQQRDHAPAAISPPQTTTSHASTGQSRREMVRTALPLRSSLLLLIIILSINTVSISIVTYSPKLFTELAFSASYVGWLAGLFMLGSAAGGIVGGNIADRFSGRLAIRLGAAGGILPTFFFIPSPTALQIGLLFLSGFFVGMPHSVLVIRVQSLLPGRQAMASGLTLGLMFFGGAVGSWIVGHVADAFGLATTLQWLALLLLLPVVAAFLLRD